MAINLAAQQLVNAQIALFDNGSFVDTANTPTSESDNVQAALTSLGHTVTTFTDLSAAGLTAALAGRSVLVIPELEVGLPTLAADARAVLHAFVAEGGTLVMFGGEGYSNGFNFLNTQLFAGVTWRDLHTDGASGSVATRGSGAVGTTFADDPSALSVNIPGTRLVAQHSFPSMTRVYVSTGDETPVALMPYVEGQVIWLGYDFGFGTSADWLQV